MTMLEKLKTLRNLKKGSVLLVCEPFFAFYAGDAAYLHLGTRILLDSSGEKGLHGTADMGDHLKRVFIPLEQFHCIEVEPA
jgi:hypothetical protein